jgi:DnaJ-class molecular chaperone
MSDDPYADLGVAKTATQEDIKKAYRKVAKTSHPDLNPGDSKAADRFKAAASAYDLLKDPERRARFDQGEIDASGQERPERRFYREYAEGPEATYHTSRGYEDLSDVFSDLFGRRAQGGGGFRRGGFDPSSFGSQGFAQGGQAHRGQGAQFEMRGPDDRYALEVSFLEAARGATRRITLPGGDALDVKIPEGIADGQTIRLRGKGGAGIGGGPAGDALVMVSVAPHRHFRREGNDIWITLPISFDEAVLGARIETPTIDGPVSLTVPKGATSGQVLRLRGRGVKKGDKRGDQHVEIRIAAPPTVDGDLEEFFRKWRESHGYDPRKGGFA